jgi:hypothetical protein
MKDARRLQFRLFRLLSLRLALTLSAGTLFAAGLLALLLRILASPSPLVLTLLVLAAALFPVVPAAVAAWRRTPLASQCLAWLDAASQSGGLLLMGSQPGAEAWRSSIPPALPEPRLNWRDTRRPALWLAAAAFAAAVLLVPDPLIRAVLAAPLDLSPLLAPLEKKAAALLDPDIPPPTAPENWRQELDATAALQDGTDPARALEALDHLRDQMDQAGAQAATTLVREQELLRASEAAAESIRAQFADGGGESQAAQDSLGAFNDFLAAQEWPASLTNALPSELLEALSAGALTPDQLAALSDLLRQEGNRLAGQLNKLCGARLIEASRCPPGSLCTNGAACEAALARFLDQDGGDSLAACLSGSRPGRGGVSRGRGDAPLTWTDLSSPEGAGFKDIRLAAASMPSPDAAKPIGLSAAAPDAKPSAAPLQPGALTSAQAAPQAGRSAVILPRHRAAVERYFQSPPAPERTP